jgi:hypothetical protein
MLANLIIKCVGNDCSMRTKFRVVMHSFLNQITSNLSNTRSPKWKILGNLFTKSLKRHHCPVSQLDKIDDTNEINNSCFPTAKHLLKSKIDKYSFSFGHHKKEHEYTDSSIDIFNSAKQNKRKFWHITMCHRHKMKIATGTKNQRSGKTIFESIDTWAS